MVDLQAITALPKALGGLPKRRQKHDHLRGWSRRGPRARAGSVRERLKPAFARGGGFAGESTRGGLPSRPPAAPAWTGYGKGGGRAQGRPGLLRRCVYRRRCLVLDCAICVRDVLIRTRRGRAWVHAPGPAGGVRRSAGVGGWSTVRPARPARPAAVSMGVAMGLTCQSAVHSSACEACARLTLHVAGLLPGAWRLCLRAGRWLGVGTGRRCFGV